MENDRRTFIKQACGLCAAMVGIGVVLPSLEACSTLATVKTNLKSGQIKVPKSMFNESYKMVIVKNQAADFDVVLVDLGNDVFKAMELQCTHQANPLIPTKKGFFCNAHGSSYSLDGKVKQEPAQTDMKSYPIIVESEFILITI